MENQNEPLAGASRSRFPADRRRYAEPPAAVLLTGQAVRERASADALSLRLVRSLLLWEGKGGSAPSPLQEGIALISR